LSNNELKRSIQNSIITFSQEPVYHAAVNLFNTLGYNTERKNPFPEKTYEFFKESFLGDDSLFSEEKAIIKDWESIDLLFQLTADEVSYQSSLFNTKQVNNTIIETYLFFSVGLSESEYTRTQLAQITREINKVFPMPVFILFKHGENITFSVINRRLNKKDTQKDVLEKVTVIKDISTSSPHRAHIEILFDLSFSELQRVHKFTNFVELHNAWQKTLDTKELNKRFYRDLSYWYFWALDEVSFPAANWSADKNSIQNEEEKVKGHNAKNLIRLLTRLLFVWFVKEKNLVPDELFDESYIKDKLLNGFEPRKKKDFDHKTQGSKYYRAILQNLFFATLNQTMGKREFRQEGRQMNVTNLMRYESYFKDPKTFIRLVEDVVPFMNGGLFECLDSPDPMLKGKEGGDVIIYEDGFSDRKDNTLCVPDYIFFGTAEHADLSAELGDKKQKDITVNGLINILKSYKFTVTENTPIEEDIALDPELLGRVFENLLASYNPETKTTARKQTGSFYTPREIVNYMVDESLKAYLKQKLEASQNSSPPFQGGVPRSGGVVNSPTTNLRSGGTVRINNLPHLKTFRKELRNNLTPAEAKLWTYLQNSQLEGRKFRRQHSVANYILDFYCPSEKLAIELDGEVHNNVEQAEYDRERDLFLLATGIKVLRFENRVVFENPQGLLDDVKNEYGWVNKTTRVFEHDGGIITTPAFGHPSLSGGELFEDKLSDLISYSENDPDFTDQQKTVLISAIDSCKILDPACGSGAFPMGILHKLVHILHKLDPNNKLWKERQIEKVNALIANAQDITDSNIREKIINDLEESKKDIETAFESNELDYGRKLFLIENCIYGVDIQPIAIQISKLRFFISLIVDQKSSPPAKGESAKREGVKENLGIRPLPNLETKFVAANTLIGIERPDSFLSNIKLDSLEIDLKGIRHRLFSAKTPATKRKLREEDQRIREEMGRILENAGLSNESAGRLAAWDPYNQNVSSGWFDPEWMFGIEAGFDVVIGNPPWIQSKVLSATNKRIYSISFKTAIGQYDLFNLFIEKGISILCSNGRLIFITPDRFITNLDYKNVREYLLKNTLLEEITSLGDNVFENVAMPSAIIHAQNLKQKNEMIKCRSYFSSDFNFKKQKDFLSNDNFIFKIFGDSSIDLLLKSILEKSDKLMDHLNNARGVEVGKNSEVIEYGFRKGLKKFLRGEDIDRYQIKASVFINTSFTGVDYKDDALYKGTKILIRKTGNGIIAVVDDEYRYVIQTIYIFKRKYNSKLNERYILGCLNSKLLGFYYNYTFGEKDRKVFPHLTQGKVLALPIFNAIEAQQQPFISLVNQILVTKNVDPGANTTDLERQVDQLVYKLYDLTEEEIKIIEGRK